MTFARLAAAVFGAVLTFAFARADVTVPPRPVQWVTDNAGALSQPAAAHINAELQAYQAATHHRVIVWIGTTTGGDQLEDWTSTVAESWGIGRKGQSDGAILFLFMQDHRVRIEVGYGLEPTLTDAISSEIINQTILPKMRAGDVDGAVQDGVDRMLVAITPTYASQIGHALAPMPQQESHGGLDGGAIIFLIFLLFGIGWFVVAVIINGIRYLWTLLTKGREAAANVWHNAWITSKGSANGGSVWPLLFLGGMGGGGGGFSGGGGGGFSSGGFGGGFGGGGASGGW